MFSNFFFIRTSTINTIRVQNNKDLRIQTTFKHYNSNKVHNTYIATLNAVVARLNAVITFMLLRIIILKTPFVLRFANSVLNFQT